MMDPISQAVVDGALRGLNGAARKAAETARQHQEDGDLTAAFMARRNAEAWAACAADVAAEFKQDEPPEPDEPCPAPPPVAPQPSSPDASASAAELEPEHQLS